MISVPRPEKPTVLARFHEVSGAIVYLLIGLILLCAPVLARYIFQVTFAGRAEAYVRLVGLEMAIVGFNYVITGRLKPKATGAGYILASVPGRLFLVNLLVLSLLLQGLLPLSLAVATFITDSLLAIISYIIWYKITDGASFMEFLKDIFRPLLVRCLFNKGRGASVAINAFGMIQLLYGIFFAIRPQFAEQVFSMNPFADHAGGYLGAFFALVCQSAWHMIYMGKARSVSFNIGAVFSRVCFKIPVLIILLATKQIERGLGVFLIVIDGAFSVITFLLLYLSGVDEDESVTPDETDAIIPKGDGEKEEKEGPIYTPPE